VILHHNIIAMGRMTLFEAIALLSSHYLSNSLGLDVFHPPLSSYNIPLFFSLPLT
jgi:hypothetical protein